jgi:Na+/H+ antiporter NhaD/arsenite permease-like protein
MLLSIAIFPLSPARHWWEKNRNRLLVAVILSAYPAVYYFSTDPHPLTHVLQFEYVPFIVLLGSLFVISGGIRLTGDLVASPHTNTAFIAIGTLLASFIGTTGAALLLIRPLLQTNRERQYKVHTVIFFIFLVANIGGSLLPIGDPPLFLGYLAGVPFFWTLNMWQLWLPTSLFLLTIYYFVDRIYYAQELPYRKLLDEVIREPLRLHGGRNFVWLLGVVASVIFMHENSPVPFFRFLYCRELSMILLVAVAVLTGERKNWKDNEFTMGPITEVAALFLGIFVTMTPALTLLQAKGGELGVDTQLEYFWGTGILSSFLDNAPTYLVFFKAASGSVAAGALEPVNLIGTGIDKVPHHILLAISAGAVFMGANTYIGNGPNFMVRAVAEEAGVRMPTFFGYMVWSGAILIPTFLGVSFLFFRG